MLSSRKPRRQEVVGGSGSAGGLWGPQIRAAPTPLRVVPEAAVARDAPLACRGACSEPGHVSDLRLDKLLIFLLSLFLPCVFEETGMQN